MKEELLRLLDEGDQSLPSRERRLKILLKSPDHQVRMRLELELMAHQWGRPRESVQLTGGLGALITTAATIARAAVPKLEGDSAEVEALTQELKQLSDGSSSGAGGP